MTQLTAESWSAAAAGYDDVFVRQFAPWTCTCVEHLRSRVPTLPDGPVWVACCGPGQELPLLHAALQVGRAEDGAPPRRIVAGDLAQGMVKLAAQKAAMIGPHVTVEVGDAMQPPCESFAVIFSVFGLQQLPDPAVAVARWVIDRKSAVNVTQTRRARSRMPARRRWRRSACMYVCMCVRMYACMYVYTYTPSPQRVRATGCVLTGRAFPPRRCDAWSAAAC
jgi:hypothetical protein